MTIEELLPEEFWWWVHDEKYQLDNNAKWHKEDEWLDHAPRLTLTELKSLFDKPKID